MRAAIDTDGCLRILPESELEEYALRKWWEGYTADGSRDSTLEVVVHKQSEDHSHD